MKPADGWATATLRDLLPQDALDELLALVNSGRCSAQDFKPVLVRYRAELEAKQVLPEYLAYALEHAIYEWVS